MAKRRRPLTTPHVSTVTYPSSLFSLEKDEVFPYERFAYNLLDIAIEALNAKGLPERVIIGFSTANSNVTPWFITASVRCELDSTTHLPIAYHFATPELVPAIVYCYCFSVGSALIDHGPTDVRQRFRSFVDAANAGVREYKQSGLAPAIRACYEQLGLTILAVTEVANSYDLLTKLIAFHEVGHAYGLHLVGSRDLNAVTLKGFELIADLLATTWFYNTIVRNTPDDDEYRTFRGFSSYSESVLTNSLVAQRAQLTLLCLMAFAGAQHNGGRLTLAGGISHPSGYQRYMLQHVHMGTLIESNFSGILSPEQFTALNEDWYQTMSALVEQGMIPIADLQSSLDVREFDTIEAAAISIEEMHIEELLPAVPILKNARELMSSRSNERVGRNRQR